ncbi:hypothetical protein Emag_006382 [Eimeria magna]
MGPPLLRAYYGHASCLAGMLVWGGRRWGFERAMADSEMNFVAATSKTFDHPTHGSMRGPQVSDEAAAAAAQKSLLLAADPLTGEPMDRSGRGKWEHDDREGEASGQYRPLTNAELRRLQGGGGRGGDGGGMGMRSETEGAREARMAAAVAAAAAAAGVTGGHGSLERGGGSAGFDDDTAAERRDRKHRRRSRSRSRSHSGERRRHKSSRKRSRSR